MSSNHQEHQNKDRVSPKRANLKSVIIAIGVKKYVAVFDLDTWAETIQVDIDSGFETPEHEEQIYALINGYIDIVVHIGSFY
jgi:hypothetical protein